MADAEMNATGESSPLEPYMRKRFEWRVDRCSRLVWPTEGDESSENYFRESPLFGFMDRTWFMRLYPNTPLAMHLYLFMSEGCAPTIVNHNFGIRTALGDAECQMQNLSYFGPAGEVRSREPHAETLIAKEELAYRMSELAKDDVLTIVCSMCSEQCVEFLRGFLWRREEFVPPYQMPELCPFDMMFFVRDHVLVANSTILSLQCPFLASEVRSGKAYLVDYNPRAYRQFLLYLYTGKVLNLLDLQQLIQLYGLAISYQVASLRERCLCLLTVFMNPENVLYFLDVAEKYAEPELASVVRKFMSEHSRQVISSPLWMQFLREKPHEANQLYILMVKTFYDKISATST